MSVNLTLKYASGKAIGEVLDELSKYKQWLGEFTLTMQYSAMFYIPFNSEEKAREFYEWAKNRSDLFFDVQFKPLTKKSVN